MPIVLRIVSFIWLFSQVQGGVDFVASREAWQERAHAVRQAILSGAHLDPMPEKTPLHPYVVHTRVRNGYSVSDVAFEAAAGFYVFGNLYVPTAANGRSPSNRVAAILVPHGHFKSLYWYARTRPENQILCGRLAQMGAVVFTYDMVGWGDSKQVEHNVPNALQLQLWDSIRALDFLQSLPFVDPNRIGVTGASGGATQAIYLAAVDDRIAASMPVVMVSSKYTGHERCEDGMPVHKVAGEEHSNNVEIAAVIAPKPLLVVSDGSDWTKNFPKEDFALLKQIYGLFPGAAPPSNVHFPHGQHDYGPSKRAVAYRFFGRSLGLRAVGSTWQSSGSAAMVRKVQDLPDADPDPEGITIEQQDDQAVLPWVNLQAASERLPDRVLAGLLHPACLTCSETLRDTSHETVRDGSHATAVEAGTAKEASWYFDK